jgi:CRP-like cAMP-binding protein
MAQVSAFRPALGMTNLFLDALPSEARASLLPRLTYAALPRSTRCTFAGEAVAVVRFPLDGMVSFVGQLADGSFHEVAVAGREGSIGGIEAFCGTAASFESFVRISGSCLEIAAAAFTDELNRNAGLRALLLRYVYAVYTAGLELLACNLVHSIVMRSARWLLMTHDRVHGDTFPMTHEYLAEMLNVRRAGITEAANVLREAGAIHYRRGSVTVVDRSILERISCPCYGTSSDRAAAILGYDISAKKRSG